MSDQLNWTSISAWFATVGSRIGTAMRGCWQQCCSRRRPTVRDFSDSPPAFDYAPRPPDEPHNNPRPLSVSERLGNGETINGWRLAADTFPCLWLGLVLPSYPDDVQASPGRTSVNELSFITHHGRSEFMLTRRSLVLPGVESKLLKVHAWGMWYHAFSRRMTDRTVASVFESRNRCCRIIFVDVFQKSRRNITIAIPDSWCKSHTKIFSLDQGDAKRLLNVVFKESRFDPYQLRFFSVKYELPAADVQTSVESPIKPLTCQPLSIPEVQAGAGERFGGSLHPPMFVVEVPSVHFGQYRLFSTDGEGTMRAETVAERVLELQSTIHGQKLEEAKLSYGSLFSRPNIREIGDAVDPEVYLNHFWSVTGNQIGGSVFAKADSDQLIQRLIYPPSLKRIAAESFCKANRGMDLRKLKYAIGFDVFDGVLDEDVGDCAVVCFQ